eukprot:7179296-Prymnesium_polylepis.1
MVSTACRYRATSLVSGRQCQWRLATPLGVSSAPRSAVPPCAVCGPGTPWKSSREPPSIENDLRGSL